MNYSSVLQLALKFMFGNKALRGAGYKTYKFIRDLETGMIADKILSQPKYKNKKVSGKKFKEMAKRFNFASKIMTMKIAFMVWKEYLNLWDKLLAKNPYITAEQLQGLISKQRDIELDFFNANNQKEENLMRRNAKKHTVFARNLFSTIKASKTSADPRQTERG